MSSYYVRTDSSSANNPAINLTGVSSFQITFIAETPTGDPGDLFLGGAPDPNTQVLIGGQAYNFTVNWIGILPTANNQGGNQVPAQFRGDAVMRISVQDYPSAGQVTYLVFMPYEQATAADMNAFGNGRIDVQNIVTNPDPVPVCYVAGTRLETPKGPVAVEDLRIGDLLTTQDDGPQPIRWIGWTEHSWPDTDEKLRPVRIPARSLNGRLPIRDLMVSPQHRILISREGFPFLDHDTEQFAPALSLEGYCGIARETACSTARYYHVLLERHSVIRAEGLCSESFYPGPMAMRSLSFRNRIRVMSLYPGLAADPRNGYGPLCRTTLTRRQAVELLGAAPADAVL
ncbi:MAG: Hint domain-containing protein [Phaeovulum sp.]|uniref:Hint domain-containing protein n=1 Tax=Phaeovulum sp. TaxID=2934796 RepID=UPI002735B43F|nr:Hint domain-containing protein [Phaeovulum sp.]MDP3863038.1 Hint domain-containing protein [Phaeovulum sp.]